MRKHGVPVRAPCARPARRLAVDRRGAPHDRHRRTRACPPWVEARVQRPHLRGGRAVRARRAAAGAPCVGAHRRGGRGLGGRQHLLDVHARRPREPAVPVCGRRVLARVLPTRLPGADPARAVAGRPLPVEPLGGRRDRRAGRRRGRHRGRLRPRARGLAQRCRGHDHQPRLPARRHCSWRSSPEPSPSPAGAPAAPGRTSRGFLVFASATASTCTRSRSAPTRGHARRPRLAARSACCSPWPHGSRARAPPWNERRLGPAHAADGLRAASRSGSSSSTTSTRDVARARPGQRVRARGHRPDGADVPREPRDAHAAHATRRRRTR